MNTLEIPWDDDLADLSDLDAGLDRLRREAAYPCLLWDLSLDEDDE
ncbi:MAG: hypothetical protein K2X35_18560 [Bryobacteraceae bacterium]|nr:hypothetical protein [Bryobacteraceae bacterium]